jgi:hypothetical protein
MPRGESRAIRRALRKLPHQQGFNWAVPVCRLQGEIFLHDYVLDVVGPMPNGG